MIGLRGVWALVAIAVVGVLWACAGTRSFDGPVYPGNLKMRSMADIQVRRDETKISFTNTTARTFGAGTLWVNAAFARPIEGLAIGQTILLDLRDFRNEFNEPFRGGGFFATERPDELILAELEVGGELVGFVVIGQDNP